MSACRPTNPQSYHYFMHENFFKHVNIAPGNIYIPSGTTSNYQSFCDWYEQRIEECGGIDVQILGIGSDGHIAFNEPGSSLTSRTRLKTLARSTIEDNARFFERRGGCADLRHHDGRRHDSRSARRSCCWPTVRTRRTPSPKWSKARSRR